jgi:hypothetical protein
VGVRFSQLIKVFVYVSIFSATSGCAWLAHRDTQRIQIDTVPPGAAVYIEDDLVGRTPYVAELARDSQHNVILEKSGYRALQFSVKQAKSTAYLGNLAVLLVWPVAAIFYFIDWHTGAVYNLYPESINVTLKPIETTSSDNNNI